MPFSRMRATNPWSLCANVTSTSFDPFPMNRFSPFRRHDPSACRSARLWMLCASEPASGSVSAKAASFRPDARSGKKRSFCSSLPNR